MKFEFKNVIVSLFILFICQVIIIFIFKSFSSFTNNKTDKKPYDIDEYVTKRDIYYQSDDKLCKIFFYDVEKDEKIYEERIIKGGENFVIELFENLNVPPQNSAVLSPQLEIYVQSCKIENDKILLDIDSSIIKTLNFSKKYEEIYLEIISNTICYALGKDKVVITLNGKDYETNNIKLMTGQPIKENIEEYKKAD